MKIYNHEILKERRKELRNNLTIAEAVLWKYLQGRKFHGRKFRRQHSMGTYIVDFYCPEEKLAIELDGEVHRNDKVYSQDLQKMQYFKNLGIQVLRFENKLVFEQLEFVLIKIEQTMFKTTPVRWSSDHPSLVKEGNC